MERFIGLKNRRVFVTGHTGFTGSWLLIWLRKIGAEVYGYSQPARTIPSMFKDSGLDETTAHTLADVRDFEKLRKEMQAFKPEVVVHLAAQPLVIEGHLKPLLTFEVNALGTANVLEASRNCESVIGTLVITTDKVYEQGDFAHAFTETDRLGGLDPYSASKSAAEHIASSYRKLNESTSSGAKGIVTVARGGNIIGGGDWSSRLVPDLIRAAQTGKEVPLRFPNAIRPWQHVITLVSGYLTILERMLTDPSGDLNGAFNFGPPESDHLTVREIAQKLSSHISGINVVFADPQFEEAPFLTLDSNKARNVLAWESPWSIETVILKTAEWYTEYLIDSKTTLKISERQIEEWLSDDRLRWEATCRQ